MSEARCDCCDLPVYACGKAAEQAQAREARQTRARLLATPGWFAAAHPGRCAACGEHFPPGTPITRHPDGWRAACCEDEEAAS